MATQAEKLKALLLAAGAGGASNAFGEEQPPQTLPLDAGATKQPPIQPVSQDPVPTPPPTQVATLPVASRSVASTRSVAPPQKLQDLQDQLRQRLLESQNAQKENIDLARTMAIGQLSKKQGVDLTPGYDVVRMISGNKHAGENYKAPEDVSAGDAPAVQALAKQQQALTDDQTNQLKAELQNKLLQNAYQNQRMDLMHDRLNEQVYGKQVLGLRNDKTLNDLMSKNNAITRTADVLFAPGQDINTTSLHDLQQTVTGALTGLPSGGGVGERADRYMTDMNTTLGLLKQKFGDVNSIPRDEPILQHYLSLAQEGQAFLQSQAHQRIKTLAGGHENVTELPTYAPMFHQQVEDLKGNLTSPKYQQDIGKTAQNFKQTYGQGGGSAAVAKPSLMDQDSFIQSYLKAKKAQNGK